MAECQLDWKKIKENSEKIGYRDGIEEGRVSNFQMSFDEGYKSGFKNGFELGKFKGQYRLHSECNNPAIKSSKLGNCFICKDNTLANITNGDKGRKQWDSTQIILSTVNKSMK